MKSKKGQTDMITTVLLVLVGLAAVALIGYFIMNQVRTTTGAAGDKTKCALVQLDIGDMKNGDTTVNIKRLGSSDNSTNSVTVNVFVNGASKNTTAAIGVGATGAVTVPALVSGQKVDASAVLALSSGTTVACDVSASKVVA